MHKFIDKLMVLLPFEPDLFNKYNLETVFVGHPIAVDEDLDEPSRNDKDAFLRKIGVRRAPKRYDCEDRIAVSICADLECNDAAQRQQREEPPQNFIVITLLPGSRPSEIDNHLPILAQFADMMVDRYENVRFIIPTIESLEKIIEEKTGDWRQKPLITTDKFQKTLAFYVSDIAIAASGTVVLELARAGLPFVVIYKTSTITAAIVKYLIQIKYVCLVNILANEPIVPELLQKNCTPQNIFDHAIRLLDIDNANAQKKSFAKIMGTLKVNHPKSAANEIIKMLT
jgi:lipid-A-disaccharide synthase